MSSAQLGWVIAEALAATGVREVVVCPGSRSTSIAVALAGVAADGRVRLHTRTDERVAGFLALGLARATGSAAIVVTSGTAVGNLLPAVMEARLAGVPLLVITADRPATLIGSGANQTTEQIGIYGRHVVADLQLTSTDARPDAWFQGLYRTIAQARGVRSNAPGPVHINAAFTEAFLAPGETWQPVAPPRIQARPRPETVELPAGPRTVVLAGDAPAQVGQAARALAEAARLPLLAEPSSNARAGDCAIAGYRVLLDAELGAEIERVLVYGHPTLSRPVTRLISRPDVELVVVSARADWPDPGWQADQVVDGVQLAPGDESWLERWQQADAALPAAAAAADGRPTGRLLAAEVVASAAGNLVLGSSNPIRDADLAPIAQHPATCWANRGLAGIDGTIATALGVALGSRTPTTLLLGDLSFLHDIGALQIPVSQPVPDLRIVVADDDGGAIFAGLEVADQAPEVFEALFTMPHGRDLASIAAGFGWPTRRIRQAAELPAELRAPIEGLEVLIVPIVPQPN